MIDFYKSEIKLRALEQVNKNLKLENEALKLLLEWAEEAGFGYDQIPEEYAEFKDDLEKFNIGYMEGFIYMAKKRVEQGCKAWFDKRS